MEKNKTTKNSPDLSGGLNASDAADVQQTPGDQQGQHHPPLQVAGVVDGRGAVERLPVPEVVDGGAAGALVHHPCRAPIKR